MAEASKPPLQPPPGYERAYRNGARLLTPNGVGYRDSAPSSLRSVRGPNPDWFARSLLVGETIDGYQGPGDLGVASGAKPSRINLLFDPRAPINGILDFDPDALPLP